MRSLRRIALTSTPLSEALHVHHLTLHPLCSYPTPRENLQDHYIRNEYQKQRLTRVYPDCADRRTIISACFSKKQFLDHDRESREGSSRYLTRPAACLDKMTYLPEKGKVIYGDLNGERKIYDVFIKKVLKHLNVWEVSPHGRPPHKDDIFNS